MDYSTLGLVIAPELQEISDERVKEVSLIGDMMLPPKMENTPTGKINKISANNDGGNGVATRRAPGAGFNRITTVYGDSSWHTYLDGAEASINAEELALATVTKLDLEAVTTEVVVDTLRIQRELRIVQSIYDTAYFTGVDYYADLAHGLNQSTCDIKAYIATYAKAIQKRSGVPKNMLTLSLNDVAYDYLTYLYDASSSKLVVDVNGMQYDAKKRAIATWLGIKDIRVGNASVSSTGLANANVDFSSLYPTDLMMLYFEASASNTWGPGLGRQPVFSPFSPNILMTRYADQTAAANIVRACEWRGVSVDRKYGFLIGNAEE